MSDCYENGDPKDETEFVGLDVCAICHSVIHTLDCPERGTVVPR